MRIDPKKAGAAAALLVAAAFALPAGRAEAQSFTNNYYGSDIDMNASGDLLVSAQNGQFHPGWNGQVYLVPGASGTQHALTLAMGMAGAANGTNGVYSNVTLGSSGGAMRIYRNGGYYMVPFSLSRVADSEIALGSSDVFVRSGNKIATCDGSTVRVYDRASNSWTQSMSGSISAFQCTNGWFAFNGDAIIGKKQTYVSNQYEHGWRIYDVTGSSPVMEKDDTIWTQCTSGCSQSMMWSADADDDRFVTGWPTYSSSYGGSCNSGSVAMTVYTKSGSTWKSEQVSTLTGLNLGSPYNNYSCMGVDVAVEGDYAATVDGRGVVYLFGSPSQMGTAGWSVSQVFDARTLCNQTGTCSGQGGWRIAMSNNKVAVSYPSASPQGTGSGAVWVFNR